MYRKAAGKPSITYEEALEEALCFGWIDGVRHKVDEERFRQRFTPRRQGSNWSAVNVRRMEALIAAGRVAPPGLAAFEARNDAPKRVYSYADRLDSLSAEFEAQFKQHPAAWAYFRSQPPWYQRTAAFYVMDAKQESTRIRRLQLLIEDSEKGLWIGPLRRAQTRGRKD
jgi:uncharacterized protein YdeI (YjbR/CyaY-like superfamily)